MISFPKYIHKLHGQRVCWDLLHKEWDKLKFSNFTYKGNINNMQSYSILYNIIYKINL